MTRGCQTVRSQARFSREWDRRRPSRYFPAHISSISVRVVYTVVGKITFTSRQECPHCFAFQIYGILALKIWMCNAHIVCVYVCVCVCVYIYTHTHTHTHTHIHTYTHTHTHTHIYVYICVCVYIYIYIYASQFLVYSSTPSVAEATLHPLRAVVKDMEGNSRILWSFI